MAIRFHAAPNPLAPLCSQAAAIDPVNPFCTFPYIAAMHRQGLQTLLLSLQEGGEMVSACAAFMRSGRLSRTLDIVSLPAFEDSTMFWEGLQEWCRRHRITHLQVGTYGSPPAARVPFLAGEIERHARAEYILELEQPELWKRAVPNHLRSIKNARRAGMRTHRTTDEHARQIHSSLVRASLERRKERGEAVPEDAPEQNFAAYLESGAGEIFQAMLNGEVLSSMLILKAERGAYSQSAGTSREGMSHGASHFLVCEIAEALRGEGTQFFNLGGAGESNPGLRHFKLRFGAREIKLESASFFLGGKLRKKLVTAIALLRDDPLVVLRRITGKTGTGMSSM